MATTGAKYPTVATTTSEAPYDHFTWLDPDNIKNNTGSYSYIDDNDFDSGIESYVLKAKGFDFSAIPDGATILGITVKVEAYYTVGAAGIALAQLLDTNGNKVGTNLASTPIPLTATTPTVETIGAADNLWGNSLTAAWVKDADFGVALAVIPTGNNTNVYVDYVTMEVTYLAPSIERTIDDGIGITDAKTSLLGLIRTVAESLGVTDANTPTKTIIRGFDESMGVADDKSRDIAALRTLAETLGLTDALIGAKEQYRTISDSVGITDPKTKLSLSDSIFDAGMAGSGWCQLKGDYAFVTGANGDALTSINISNPADLSIGQVLTDPVLNRLEGCEGIEIKGNYAFVGGIYADTFNVIDITDPTDMSIVASLNDDVQLNGVATIAIYGNYAFVGAYYNSSITVVDITNPLAPSIVEIKKDTDNLGLPVYIKVTSDGQNLFVVARGSDKFVVMDISNPLDISIKGSCSCGIVSQKLSGLAISDNEQYVFMTEYADGDSLHVIDVSVLTAPEVIGTVTNHFWFRYSPCDFLRQ